MLYFILEIIGTVAFAISGAMTGIEQKMDILGVAVLGTTTAVGGGIIRDIIIGVTPPTAFQNPLYAIISLCVSLLVFLPFIRKRVNPKNFFLMIIDSLGLAVFTVVGVRAGMEYDNMFLQIFLGTVTGVGGGVVRDMFAAKKPSIFVRHFYACAAISGAIVCSVLFRFGENIAMLSGMGVTLVLRICAAQFKWELPRA